MVQRGIVKPPYTARQGTAIGRAGKISIAEDGEGVVWTGGATQTVVRGSVTF